MENKFTITKLGNDKLLITGEDSYDSETSIDNGTFTYEDTTSINLIYKVYADESEELVDMFINSHEDLDETVYTFESDGLYRIVHIIIPNMSWLDKYTSASSDKYSFVFVTDGKDLYKYAQSLTSVDISDMLEVNQTVTNVLIDDVYTFSIGKLQECYYNISTLLLKQICESSCTLLSDLTTYKRDVLWMGINSILYLLEKGTFFEALRLFESIHLCADFCNTNTNTNISSCGCNSRS